MINVKVAEDEKGVLVECTGHAGFAPKGLDIVCAGVSALCMALHKAVRSYFGPYSFCETAEGYMKLSFPLSAVEAVKTEMAGAVNMFVFGIYEIERLYPAYVKLIKDYLPLWVRYIDTPEQTAEKERGGSI